MQELIILSTSINVILTYPGFRDESDKNWKVDYICRCFTRNDHTYYCKIRRLPPGHLLKENSGTIFIERVLSYEIKKRIKMISEKGAVNKLSKLLEDSVRAHLGGHTKVGIELSGGLDSACICAILTSLQRKKPDLEIFAYSHCQSKIPSWEKQNDERENIIESIEELRLDTARHRFIDRADQGIISLYEHAFKTGNQISINHYAIYSKDIYEQASKDGVTLIFSGWGGDQCLSHLYTRSATGSSYMKTGRLVKSWIRTQIRRFPFFAKSLERKRKRRITKKNIERKESSNRSHAELCS